MALFLFFVRVKLINPRLAIALMYVVFGVTSGMSSMSFEGRYKEPDDVRDVHVSDAPRVNHVLHSFVITNDDRDLVLWSFDIPGYETHVYSAIKERATLMLCPRIDNSTYLLPDITLLRELSSVLSGYDYRDVAYFVRPLSGDFVVNALRRTYDDAMAIIARMLTSAGRARGAALMRLMDKVDYAEELLNKALALWEVKGYGIDPLGIRNAIGSVREVLDRRVGKANR